MKLEIKINKIKSINHLEIDLPIEKGLYAVTGQNGSGKSTLVTCASSVFFNMRMKDYFGDTDEDAYISFVLDGATRSWKKNQAGKWSQESTGMMNIKGFYEGSIIFGNRFRNTSYKILQKLDRVDGSKLSLADEFIRKNLGKILHNSEDYYEKLLKVNHVDAGPSITFQGDLFYYERGGRRVSQFHMSTGENLLVSVLNSINIRNNDRASLAKPCVMFLDEIELALHPSSLKRLVAFLREISDEFNYAIYFSTHSIELIGAIHPENIFFLERHADSSVEILNPCYPAYATRILYDHSGYDYIFLVEDDLAKEVINRLLRKNSLLSSKLVHVLPCGGYTNVIELAREVVNSNLVGKTASISIILDGDVRRDAQAYMVKHGIRNNIPLTYLPIESLEKYLKSKLHDNVDHKLFRKLNDFIFHQVSLTEIIEKYKTTIDSSKDGNGKKLFDRIASELHARGKTRGDLVEIVVEHLIDSNSIDLENIVHHLKEHLSK
ncbi:putative ATP binding protein [Burkholderia pseudomallei]|nr:putative ATP binding protein [Burkholderia pseudomallei]CAJ3787151.1 putative ATP binding protein [Burkholderia pseudomallei]CAJ4037643.1 putative ATP binding protein [Burkholderia pseudomallei]CAJ4524857.1 putative ATP binding protein [Burkholderia pseudomallei]CAJ5886959.1 putative ATP binding protein [Burkholderia pseudomallei]